MATVEELESLISGRPGAQPSADPVAKPKEARQIPKARVREAFGPSPIPALEQEPFSQLEIDAMRGGVSIDNPAPSGQFQASFGATQNDQLLAYRIALSPLAKTPEGFPSVTEQTRLKELGNRPSPGIEVRVGPETGAIEWNDPEVGWSLANPPGSFLPNVKGFGADALRAEWELALGTLAGMATRSPMLTTGAEAMGAALGHAGVLLEGQRMGLNRGMSDEDIAKAAIKHAGGVAAFGYAGAKATALVQFFTKVLKGQPVGRTAAQSLDLDMDEAHAIQDAINSKTNANKLRFSLAEASGDEDLLALQDYYSRGEFKKEFGEFADDQAAALREFFSTVNEPFRRVRQPGTPTLAKQQLNDEQALQRAIDVADNRVSARITGQDRMVEQQTAQLNDTISSLKDRPLESIGTDLREAGLQEQAIFRDWASQKASQINRIAGNAEIITNRNTNQVARRLDSKVRRALFPTTQAGTGRLLPPERINVVDPSTGQPMIDPVTEEVVTAPSKIFDPNAKFTFTEAWEAVSDLKRIKRVAAQGLSTETPEVAAVEQLIGALERDMRNSMQSSRLGVLYDNFTRSYAINKKRLDEGAFGRMMERRGGPNGRWVVRDEAVFSNFWRPADLQRAQDLHSVINHRPTAMDAMRRAIVDDYKRATMRDGRVNPDLHRQYLSRHRKQLGLFFTKDEMAKINRIGGAEAALIARKEHRDKAVKEINRSFDGKIASLEDPGKLLALLRDDTSEMDARRLVKLLNRTPDVLRGVRRAYINRQIANKLVGAWDRGERALSVANFDAFLFGKGQKSGQIGTIRALFGKQYAMDLITLGRALKVSSREARFPNRSNTAFYLDTLKNLTRAYVGLFTRPGRILTALDRIRGKVAARTISRAIMNPESLRELVSLRGADLTSQKAIGVLSGLGASALLASPAEVDVRRGQQQSPQDLESLLFDTGGA